MRSDEELARDTHLHETGKNTNIDALDIALVRAGMVEALGWVRGLCGCGAARKYSVCSTCESIDAKLAELEQADEK